MYNFAGIIKAENDMIEYNRSLTEYTKTLKIRAGDKMLEQFSLMRKMPLDIVNKSDIFYIGDATEMLLPQYIDKVEDFGVISPTNKKPIFHNRYVIPIKDIHGNVQNLVGYSKEADERYVYGTAKYYRRRDTWYGLENLETAYELGYAIITEGITDTIRVRSLGYPNTFARCGTHDSEFMMRQLNRCRYGVIKIPDRDSAGKRAAKKWTSYRGITLNTFIKYKDIDEMCADSDDNINTVKEYIDICIDWVVTQEHRGYTAQSQEVTMYV
jgi:5S rRNA maturation endonuclease (ribonuclease M5)